MEYVVITGGASGMGRATAVKLAQNGYHVFSLDINKNEETPNITQLIVDATNMQSIEAAHDVIAQKTDEIKAIINFAGIIMMNSLIEISEADFVKMFNVNLFGAYRVNKVFFDMVQKGNGKVIVTTSEVAPNKILPFNAIYGITKRALDAYAEGLRMELGLLNIPVVTLRPGAVKTKMLNSSTNSMNEYTQSSVLYKDMVSNFKKIVDSQQGGNISAEKIANLVLKIVQRKKPKCVYTKNASLKLKLLNLVPAKLQLKIFKKLLK